MLEDIAPGKDDPTVPSLIRLPLAPLTTLKLGGPAPVIRFTDRATFPDVVNTVRTCVRGDGPVCLGWGSNVLVADQGSDDPVLLIGYSFGAAVAASITHPAVVGWALIDPSSAERRLGYPAACSHRRENRSFGLLRMTPLNLIKDETV